MTQCFKLPDGNVCIAFSGGRTSAYMLHQILEANGPLPDRVLVSFQNTGREDFVARQDDWIFNTEGALCQADDGECTG